MARNTENMDWGTKVTFIINAFVVVIHLLALPVLFKFKVDNLNGNQKYLLASLCITELTLGANLILISIFTIIHTDYAYTITNILYISFYFPLYLTYFSIMILITIDRLLEFRLNIKYSLHWFPKKIKVILVVVIAVYMSIFICMAIVRFYKLVDGYYRKYLMNYVIPIFSVFFLVLASCTYYQIYKKIKGNRKTNDRIKHVCEAQNSHMQIGLNQKKRLQIFLPSLIIATFILFSIVPNLLWVFYSFKEEHEALKMIIAISFPIGWVADPMIYIFCLKPVRMRMKRAFIRFSYKDETQSSSLRLSNKNSEHSSSKW